MNRQSKWASLWVLGGVTLCGLASSCATADELAFDYAKEGDARFDAIRRRLPITIEPGPGMKTGIVGCDTAGCMPDAFANAVSDACQVHAVANASRNTAACIEDIRRIEAQVCAAHTLMLVVDAVAPQIVELGDGTSVVEVTVPPQDTESNAEIAAFAFEAAALAASYASDAFDDTRAEDPNCATVASWNAAAAASGLPPESPLSQLAVGEELARFYAEAIFMVRETSLRLGEFGAAISDAAYSRRTDAAEASVDMLAPFASRTAAAHLLVGGEAGLPALAGVEDDGFYSRARLSGEGQLAVQLLRAAAVSPALVSRTDATIDEMVVGSGLVPEVDSVRFRLGTMQDRASLLGATSADDVYELLGLSRAGFLEARAHLREELIAFSRIGDLDPSTYIGVPPELLPDRVNTTEDVGIKLYAAVRNPPQQLLPSRWAAVLRYDSTPQPALAGYPNITSPPAWEWRPDSLGSLPPGYTWGEELDALTSPPRVDGRRTVGSAIDELLGRGPEILGAVCASGCAGDDGVSSARDIIAEVLAEFGTNPVVADAIESGKAPDPRYDTSEYIGRARACWFDRNNLSGLFDIRFDIEGVSDASELLVVRRRIGLECAVRGTVEGTECDQTLFDAFIPQNVTDHGAYGGGHSLVLEQEPVHDYPNAGETGIWIVRRRPGYSGDPAPGQYEELTGFILSTPASPVGGFNYCQSTVIAPELDRQAAALIQPSTSAPYRPAQSCAGLPSDIRIPLENELTDDGNGVESSWRHYLELARRASEEADMLGEDLIRTGLGMDERAEAAADALSRLCGVSINVSAIGDALDPSVVPRELPLVGECDDGYVERGGACLLDLVLYAAKESLNSDDMARLASCLGADLVDWATLGNQPLCLWDRDVNSSAGLCEGATNDSPCPFPADAAGACVGVELPTGATAIPVSETIGIFALPEELPPEPPDPSDLACDALARLRASGATVQGDGLGSLLTFESMSYLARNLSWEARVGNHSTVRYGGSGVFGTGRVGLGSGSASKWPMGDTLPPGTECPGGLLVTDPYNYQGPLFCLQGMHDQPAINRVRMNDLLARGVLALKIYTGTPLSGVIFPYYARTSSDTYQYDPETFLFQSLLGSAPAAFCAPDGTFNIDHHEAHDLAGVYDQQLSNLGSEACVIVGTPGTPGSSACGTTIPSGAEWATCPYDRPTCTEVFDDSVDCDDSASSFERDVLLVLRPADADLSIAGAVRPAVIAWDRQVPAYMNRAAVSPAGVLNQPPAGLDIRDFTNYYAGWPACDRKEYEDCVRDQPELRLLEGGNRAFIGAGGLTVTDLLNGMELACGAARQGVAIADTSCDEPPQIVDLSDAYRVAAFYECRANELAAAGATSVVQNLPRRVVDALREDGAGSVGSSSGEFAAQVAEMRAGLVALTAARTATASDLRAFSSRFRELRAAVSRSERARDIEELMMIGRGMDRVTQCVSSMARSTGLASVTSGALAAASATCTNSVAQVFLDRDINRLRNLDIDDQIISLFAGFNVEVARLSKSFSDRAADLRIAMERIDAALSRLRDIQMQARRAASRALMMTDDGMGYHSAVDTVYRARLNTQLTRYKAAHKRAIRTAFIARIALEQRLGMSLSEIESDLFADEAPREWVDEICTLPSIDYDRIRAATPGTTGVRAGDDSDFSGPDGYAGAYVGDYVRKLEQVFETYSFAYPFREGTDQVVISLRDDVFRTQAPCPVETTNLLFNAGNLHVTESTDRPGWRIEGCDPAAVVGTGIISRQCVSVERLDVFEGVVPPYTSVGAPDFGGPAPYRFSFGDTVATTSVTRWEQRVVVAPGRYRVSWFARDTNPAGSDPIEPHEAVVLTDSLSANLQIPSTDVFSAAAPGFSDWRRYWFFAETGAEMEVRVAVPVGSTPTVSHHIDVAAVMLEDVTRAVTGNVMLPAMDTLGKHASPPPFMETGDGGYAEIRACTDIEGSYFRREAWTRGCVTVCSDGYGGRCSEELAETRCYWQTSFDVSSDVLQRSLLSTDAGFSAGNYNYRMESVAVNLVGTGLRDCGERGGAPGCYASGNFPYSILHAGPYLVRNAKGAVYAAPLFPGRLESARALAAERYLTNPISSADQSLLEPYTRHELQGRPLWGALILRVWDDASFDFEKLEDVQIALKYRYWQQQR